MTRIIIGLGSAFLIAASCYIVGHDHGRKFEQVKRSESKDAAQDAINARDAASATITAGTLSYQWAALPPIELRTYEARERVKILYSDQPVDCVPVRPAGVQAELDEARQRANAAAGQLRTRANEITPADPGTR